MNALIQVVNDAHQVAYIFNVGVQFRREAIEIDRRQKWTVAANLVEGRVARRIKPYLLVYSIPNPSGTTKAITQMNNSDQFWYEDHVAQ